MMSKEELYQLKDSYWYKSKSKGIGNNLETSIVDTALALYEKIEALNAVVLHLDTLLADMRISKSQEELNNISDE